MRDARTNLNVSRYRELQFYFTQSHRRAQTTPLRYLYTSYRRTRLSAKERLDTVYTITVFGNEHVAKNRNILIIFFPQK